MISKPNLRPPLPKPPGSRETPHHLPAGVCRTGGPAGLPAHPLMFFSIATMENLKSTPGPWKSRINEESHAVEIWGPVLEGAPNGCAPLIALPQRRLGAKRGQPQGWREFNQNDLANVELMTSAPELLNALIAARKEIKMWHDINSSEEMKRDDWNAYQSTGAMQIINDAILKATQP